jgi:putative membrane protein
LLGVLLAMSSRVLYVHAGHGDPADALHDQHVGGVLMLVIGGLSYMGGALVLLQRLLHPRQEAHG